ncbi:MAG: lysophospholipid acyltransferase family protein [Kiritimatiellia bacterium]
MKPTPRHYLEYALVRAFQLLLGLLPLRLAFALAWLLLRLVFHTLRPKRAQVAKRVRQVFGDQTPRRTIDRIAWLTLRNMVFNTIEMMRADRFDKTWVDRHMPDFGPQIGPVKKLIDQYGGIVITVPHYGNWDLAAIACRIYGIRMIAIASKQKNPLLNNWINRTRTHGTQIVERQSRASLRQVAEVLANRGALAILADISLKHQAIQVPFLGGTANVGEGVGRFAHNANVPILVAAPHRVGWTQFHFEVLDTLYPDPAAEPETDTRRLVAAVMAGFDRAIRADPGQWFWFNKRWILSSPKE